MAVYIYPNIVHTLHLVVDICRYVCLYVLQDLIPVKFTQIADRDDKTSLIAKGVGCIHCSYTPVHVYT